MKVQLFQKKCTREGRAQVGDPMGILLTPDKGLSRAGSFAKYAAFFQNDSLSLIAVTEVIYEA